MTTDIQSMSIVLAGIPKTNYSLYLRVRFVVSVPTAFIQLTGTTDDHSMFICRDIEM